MRLLIILLLHCLLACAPAKDAFTGTWMLQYKTGQLGGPIDSKWGAGTVLMTFDGGQVWQDPLANQAAFIDTMNYEQIGNNLEFTLDTTTAYYEIVELSHRRMVLSTYESDGDPLYTVWEPAREEEIELGLEEIKELLINNYWSAPALENSFEFLSNGQLKSDYANSLNHNLWWLNAYGGNYYLGLFDPNVSPTIVRLESITKDQIKGISYSYDKKKDFFLESQEVRELTKAQLLGEWSLASRSFPLYEWVSQHDSFLIQEVAEQFKFESDQLVYTRGELVDSLGYSISPTGHSLLFEEWRSYWKGIGWRILEYSGDQWEIEMERDGISDRGWRTSYRDTLVFVRG